MNRAAPTICSLAMSSPSKQPKTITKAVFTTDPSDMDDDPDTDFLCHQISSFVAKPK